MLNRNFLVLGIFEQPLSHVNIGLTTDIFPEVSSVPSLGLRKVAPFASKTPRTHPAKQIGASKAEPTSWSLQIWGYYRLVIDMMLAF